MVTFLNRIVYDYDGDAGHRFACDVKGTNDHHTGDNAWKQCKGSRASDVRASVTPGWLVLASSVRKELQDDLLLRCDAFLMMKTVLPLALDGSSEFDDQNFNVLGPKWGSEVIEAKHNFYHFNQAYKQDCSWR